MNLEQLKKDYVNCCRCPILCKSRTQVVFGEGNPSPEVLLIGEAPGATEDQQGIPFCGMSGKVLDLLLQTIGLERDKIFITNTVLCRPPNNRNPTSKEVENCSGRLNQLISILKPKIIVTVGNFATQRILGKTGITSIQGKVFQHHGLTVIPVLHPANYLYSGKNHELLAQMKQNFQVIGQVLEQLHPQKNLSEF